MKGLPTLTKITNCLTDGSFSKGCCFQIRAAPRAPIGSECAEGPSSTRFPLLCQAWVGRLMLCGSSRRKDRLIDYCRLMIPLIWTKTNFQAPLFIATHLTLTPYPTTMFIASIYSRRLIALYAVASVTKYKHRSEQLARPSGNMTTDLFFFVVITRIAERR